MTVDYREFYRGRSVMITGGIGFIGSNLARHLVELGADVLLVDSLIPITAATSSTIQIYGDGSQLRDFVFVDDAADAFLRAGASDACNGEVFNIGGDRPISHRELTTLLLEVAGSGRVEYVEWPPEKKTIDIGSFYADSSKFKRTTGWTQQVPLEAGLRRTVAFYREHFNQYVDAERAEHV